jgi:hypothetical protein
MKLMILKIDLQMREKFQNFRNQMNDDDDLIIIQRSLRSCSSIGDVESQLKLALKARQQCRDETRVIDFCSFLLEFVWPEWGSMLSFESKTKYFYCYFIDESCESFVIGFSSIANVLRSSKGE